MESILRSFTHTKKNLTSGSFTEIYLVKQDKGWRNRKGREEYLLLLMQEVGAKKLKMVVFVPGIFILSELGNFYL
jgi:hypothetical protein